WARPNERRHPKDGGAALARRARIAPTPARDRTGPAAARRPWRAVCAAPPSSGSAIVGRVERRETRHLSHGSAVGWVALRLTHPTVHPATPRRGRGGGAAGSPRRARSARSACGGGQGLAGLRRHGAAPPHQSRPPLSGHILRG